MNKQHRMLELLVQRLPTQRPATNKVHYVEPTNGSLNPSEVVGRREVEVSFLVHDLIVNSESNYNQFVALGIVGTAGSGKTTVCKIMFNSPEVQEHFHPRIWVCMTEQPSDDPDPKVTVAERMLTCLGEDEEIIEKKCKEEGISGLVSLLHRQLVGKRYLIVLDDAWDADEWYEKLDLGFDYSIQHKPNEGKNFTWVHSTDWSQSLAFGLPKGYGGAVIVNGRRDKLVEMMVGQENLHHLLPMGDEDCWAIFKKATGVNPELDPQVEELRSFVVQEAGGHPFMAKLMGQCYRDMRPPAEDTAQQEADNSNVSTVEESPIRKANSSNGSSTAQETGPEGAHVTAQQPVNSSNGSSTAQETGPEAAHVTAQQPVNSSNGSSIAQETGPEAAQEPQLLNSGDGSSMAQLTAPDRAEGIALQSVDSSGVKKNQPNRTKSLGSSLVKFPFGLSRIKKRDC